MLLRGQSRRVDSQLASRAAGGSVGRVAVVLTVLMLAVVFFATFFVLGRFTARIQPSSTQHVPKPRNVAAIVSSFEAKFSAQSLQSNATQTDPNVFERRVTDLAGETTQFHLVLNTSIPTKYSYLRDMPCFTSGCQRRNNWRAYTPCAAFDDNAAEYNLLGVRTMERIVDSLTMPVKFETGRLLESARGHFEAAVRLDPNCPTYSTNLALLMLKSRHFASALEFQAQAQDLISQLKPSNESAYQMAFNLFLQCFIHEVQNVTSFDSDACIRAGQLNTSVITDYRGVFWVPSPKLSKDFTAQGQSLPFLVDMLLFKYFASLPAWQYAQFSSFHQNQLALEGYVTVRQIFPGFVFEAYRACYGPVSEDIQAKRGQYWDGLRKRTQIMDDRCGRFMHYQTTDLIRVLSNSPARPSFTKFAQYFNGSSLDRHHDNDLCLWNLSFTVHVTSETVVHDMRLGLVDRKRNDVLEELWPNDGFIFMGKELMHFREGSPAENESLWQVFMHWDVENKYKL